MRQITRNIFAFFMGLSPLIVGVFIALVILQAAPNPVGVLISSLVCLGGISIGWHINKRVRIVGPIEVMSHIHASPDLDNLKPVPGDDYVFYRVQEYVQAIAEEKQMCHGGSIRIFGDWFDEPYMKFYRLSSIRFLQHEKKLILKFEGDVQIEVWNPYYIFESTTYMKILQASKIEVTWYKTDGRSEEDQSNLLYEHVDKKVFTKEVGLSKTHKFDVSAHEPALMITTF